MCGTLLYVIILRGPWTARPVLIAFAAYCTGQPVTQNNYNDTGPKSQWFMCAKLNLMMSRQVYPLHWCVSLQASETGVSLNPTWPLPWRRVITWCCSLVQRSTDELIAVSDLSLYIYIYIIFCHFKYNSKWVGYILCFTECSFSP